MHTVYEVDMRLDECLISAKARLVMTAFVDLKDEENTEIMHLLEDISRENKRLLILVFNARKNPILTKQYNITACPTFLFFRSCQLVWSENQIDTYSASYVVACMRLGSRVTTSQDKLRKDVAKYNQIFPTRPQQ